MDSILQKLPSQEILDKRFQFIEDEVLRANIVIALRYITFLVALELECDWPGAISYSIFKNIILYTATIVESCIYYALRELVSSGKIKSSEVMGYEWRYQELRKIYDLPNDEKIFGVKKVKYIHKLRSNTQFKELLQASQKCELFSKKLVDKINKLREQRNKIHLAGLKKVDDYYDKNDTDLAFKTAKLVLRAVEKKLNDAKE